MKLLGLLRHAKSDWDDIGKRDFDRGLNERGRRGAALIGKHIENHGVAWDTIVASPAERVKKTIESAMPDADVVYDKKLYLAGADTLMDVIRDHAGDGDSVLLVGHNPGMQELLFSLVPPHRENALFDEASVKFPTATFALFELNIESWDDLKEFCGDLTHFARPRDLDPELGPEN